MRDCCNSCRAERKRGVRLVLAALLLLRKRSHVREEGGGHGKRKRNPPYLKLLRLELHDSVLSGTFLRLHCLCLS